MTATNDMNALTHNMMKSAEDAQGLLSGYVNAASRSNAAAMKGMEDIAKNLHGSMQESYARMISACKTIMSAKSPQEAADTHAEFMKDAFDNMVASSGKLSEITMRAAKSAMEPLSQHATEAMGTVMKKVRAA